MNTEDEEFERIEREIAWRKVKQAAQPEQSQIFCKHCNGSGAGNFGVHSKCVCQYNKPALEPRMWVGLSEEERSRIWSSYGVSFVAIEDIEAKLKEKNT